MGGRSSVVFVGGLAFCDNDESERVHVRSLLAKSDADEHDMI